MGAVTLNDKEQRRAQVMDRLCTGAMRSTEAALLLGVSVRQIRRLREAYMQSGIPSLVHGNTGRPPANKTRSSAVEALLSLCGKDGPYHDFNVCHAKEKLSEVHGLVVGRSTLDRLLKEHGKRPRKRHGKVTRRSRREPYAQEGTMVQIDGSPHAWLEDRAEKMCLMGGIDDATSQVVYGRFHKTEDQAGYLMLLRGISQVKGVPMSIYHDKHTILRSPKVATLEEELMGVKPMSQVQRVMEGLGIEAIPADSPQAKGRVERLWKTLQDRLTKEMRLVGISSLEEANAFLPAFLEDYNRRFGKTPRDPATAWIRLPNDADLVRLFSTREMRTVANDHTISFEGVTYLLLRHRADRSLAGRKIGVHVTPEGTVHFYDRHNRLDHQVCLPVAPATDTPVKAVVPDIVRLALEHRSGVFNPHRNPPSHTKTTPQALPATT